MRSEGRPGEQWTYEGLDGGTRRESWDAML